MKLPRLVKKLRVMMAWTLDLLFGRDIEQMITLRDVEELSERWARIRAERRRTSGSRETTADDRSQKTRSRSDGHDDRYCIGRYCRIALWRFSKCRDGLGHAQNTRNKREEMRAELNKREALYGEFINECSNA